MLSVLTFRTPSRGGREGQQHAVRPVRGRVDRQGLADPQDGQRSCAPAWSGPTRSTSSTRPARSVATRSPATAARAAATAWRRTSRVATTDEPDRRPQDLQALHRRRVPPLGVGPLLRRQRLEGEVRGQRRPRLAQGRPRRRRRRPQGASTAGPAGPPTTARRSSTASPRSWRTAARSSSRRCASPRA